MLKTKIDVKNDVYIFLSGTPFDVVGAYNLNFLLTHECAFEYFLNSHIDAVRQMALLMEQVAEQFTYQCHKMIICTAFVLKEPELPAAHNVFVSLGYRLTLPLSKVAAPLCCMVV